MMEEQHPPPAPLSMRLAFLWQVMSGRVIERALVRP